MLKAEILKQAQAMEIVISENIFERYFEYGLIVSDKTGQGYVRGVKTQYHVRSMEAIELIDTLKSSRMFKHQKDYIFILYWKGFPIQWYKLKARIIEFHTSIMSNFKDIADYTANPDYREIIDDIAADEADKAPKAIGRPTSQSREVQKMEAQEKAKRYILVSKLISGLFNNGTISQDVFHSFNQGTNIESAFMDDSILVHANNWLQMKTWRDAVKRSEEEDYQETYELIALLKQYWSDLVGNYGDFYDVPLIGGFVKKLEEDFHIKVFSDRPWFYRFVTLILISGGFRQQLLKFLSTSENRKSWNQLIAAIPSLLTDTSGEEVTLNG
ncbi:hypothetical protein M5X11_07865 [Paenibacillus alginolyticus]|uniref:hypothetical protein n=1 Tax=Paenibacillus alginolyticus TaxID=59839 RepID=UPI00040AB831|nr:hypothetical protein [Paenibacillus alginolyticus]MCY9664872.1 hypothetical protein [Paenibacillus alginolyticus]